jgi:hypothetical protein
LNLIDGDRTGTVLTEFFNRISKELKLKTDKLNETEVLYLNIPTEPTIGFVQTYYANYSSSEYLQRTFDMKQLESKIFMKKPNTMTSASTSKQTAMEQLSSTIIICKNWKFFSIADNFYWILKH